MFKPLIKKVRENSNNPSILPENNSDEITENSSKDNKNSLEHENSSSIHTHRRSDSNIQQSLRNEPRSSSTSHEAENKDELVKSLSDMFSPYSEEPVSINNYMRILKSWIDSKEEILRQKDDTIQRLMQETLHLQNEMTILRSQVTDLQNLKEKNTSDNSAKVPYLQKQIDTLRSDNENLKLTIKSLRIQLSDVESDKKTENERHEIEIQNLKQALIERDSIIEQQDKRLLIDHETRAIQTDEDQSFVQVLAEPDVDTISKLQAELDDKNRTIKNLQQRYNDLRKTLQREFHASIPKDLNQIGSSKPNNATSSSPANLPLIHYDASATSQSDVDVAKRASTARQMTAVRKNVTFTSTTTSAAPTSPAILPHTSVESTSTKSQMNGHRSSIDGQTTLNSTNFKYLKHVLLKFMTSTEDEAIHLIRAVSTLLSFSADEERLLRETLDYKMSWFGKVSRHKALSSNINF
ncbi:unnamed protein product [Rotaria sp. Silwood1]|nr:unnamed protein product [Rotaria sp. Silwood1]